jgi:hypothetical protein
MSQIIIKTNQSSFALIEMNATKYLHNAKNKTVFQEMLVGK